MPKLSDFVGNVLPPGSSTIQGNGAMKASIILFDYNPGTRSITLNPGTYRVAVVGGGVTGGTVNGGGYSEYILTVNTSGGYGNASYGAGGASGHRFGNGGNSGTGVD